MTSKPTTPVAAALRIGALPLAGGLAAAYWYSVEWRKGRGKATTVKLLAGDRRVEVGISPTGRSVRVFVDGREVTKP